MKCPICQNQMENNFCNNCGWEEFICIDTEIKEKQERKKELLKNYINNLKNEFYINEEINKKVNFKILDKIINFINKKLSEDTKSENLKIFLDFILEEFELNEENVLYNQLLLVKLYLYVLLDRYKEAKELVGKIDENFLNEKEKETLNYIKTILE